MPHSSHYVTIVKSYCGYVLSLKFQDQVDCQVSLAGAQKCWETLSQMAPETRVQYRHCFPGVPQQASLPPQCHFHPPILTSTVYCAVSTVVIALRHLSHHTLCSNWVPDPFMCCEREKKTFSPYVHLLLSSLTKYSIILNTFSSKQVKWGKSFDCRSQLYVSESDLKWEGCYIVLYTANVPSLMPVYLNSLSVWETNHWQLKEQIG